MSLPTLQSVAQTTPFSRLDLRTKLVVFVTTSVIAIVWDDPKLTGGLALAILLACRWVGISSHYLIFMIRVMAPFFLLLLFTHGFFNVQYVLKLTGQASLTPVLSLPETWPVVGGMSLSAEGLLYGSTVIFKSMIFLLLVPLCVFTTDPNHLVVGLVRLRVPYKLAFLVSSTLRFFPLIFDEIQAVIETQRLRGFALEEMSTLERVRTYSKIAVPVILNAMHKAQQIEVVLQSKAFSGSARRTYLHDSDMRHPDWLVIATAGAATLVVLWLNYSIQLGRFGSPF